MARYYFNLHDGETWPDERGTEFETLDDAKREGMRLVGEVIKDSAVAGPFHRKLDLRVTNEADRVMFAMSFEVIEGLNDNDASNPEEP